MLQVYKILDTATGKFKLRGAKWGPTGRTWTSITQLKLTLNELADAAMKEAPEFALLKRYNFVGPGPVEREEPEAAPAYRALLDQVHQIRCDPAVLFSYLPPTWVVMQQQPDGTWAQLCLCREIRNHDARRPDGHRGSLPA